MPIDTINLNHIKAGSIQYMHLCNYRALYGYLMDTFGDQEYRSFLLSKVSNREPRGDNSSVQPVTCAHEIAV